MTQPGSIDEMPEDDSTRKLIERAQEAWGRLRASIVWDEWIVIGHALEAGSRDIMRHYQLNERIGAKWNRPWGEWLTKHGLDDIHKSARSYLLKIMDNYIEIEAWRRDVLSQADRVKLNHPQNVWSRFNSKRKGPNEDRRVNPLEVERDKLLDELHGAQDTINQMGTREKELEGEVERLRADREWHVAGNDVAQDRDAWKKRAEIAEAQIAMLAGARRKPKPEKTEKKKRGGWSEVETDYLIHIHTEDPALSNEMLAKMCTERCGRHIGMNAITGAINRLRNKGRIPVRRPKAA